MMVWKIILKKRNLTCGNAESGSISGRLPDDPGGFTCMLAVFLYIKTDERAVVELQKASACVRSLVQWSR